MHALAPVSLLGSDRIYRDDLIRGLHSWKKVDLISI